MAAALTGLCAVLTGCALGNVGTLTANVERHDEVSVLSIYSVGLHLRSSADDPGAHFGFSKRSHVFVGDEALVPGWYFFRVPSPAGGALAQDLTTFGVDLSMTEPAAGISLGYVHTRLIARVPSNADMLIEFVGQDLRIEKMKTCEENTACTLPLQPR
ncbi:MAG: hypothetical protein ABI645_05370 [Pseudomonadota bacterium]